MKTSELIGQALNWAAAKAKGFEPIIWNNGNSMGLRIVVYPSLVSPIVYSPTTDWSQGGPIIEQEGIHIKALRPGFECWTRPTLETYYGPTLLTAALRCYVASKLGDEVELPKELHD